MRSVMWQRCLGSLLGLLVAAAGAAAADKANSPAPSTDATAAAKAAPKSGQTDKARDPSQRFLDALREHGMFDLALEFLDQARTSPLVSAQFRQVIDYERAVTMIAGRRQAGGLAAQERQLDQAQSALTKFQQEHPQHVLAAGAIAQLSAIQLERGRLRAEQAAKAKNATEREQFLTDARKLFQAAQATFTKAEQVFAADNKKFPSVIDAKDVKTLDARDAVRRNLLQARLSLAELVYDIAQTYPKASDERKKLLTESADKYYKLFDKYQPRLVAFYARIGEARCHKDLGDTKKAVEALLDCLEQPDDPQEFRDMKHRATALLVETYVAAKNYKDAVTQGQNWLKTARPDEELSDDGLAIRYYLGCACMESARPMKDDNPAKAGLILTARRALAVVEKQRGDLAAQARNKLNDALLAARGIAGDVLKEPTNFAAAYARAQDAIGRMTAADQEARAANEEGKRDVARQLQTQMEDARDEALKYFALALRLARRDSPRDDVNVARYYLAYLYYVTNRVWEAAALSEFIVRRYPESNSARPAAQIALAAFGRLFAEVPTGEDSSFEIAQLKSIADFVSKRWPNQQEADEAWILLVKTAIYSGNLAQAREHLKQVPESSPRRSEAELVTGHALWISYLRGTQQPEEQRPPQEKLNALREEAAATLEAGVSRMRKAVEGGSPLTVAMVSAAIDLAQILVGTGKAAEALKILEDPKLGPYTLLTEKSPLVDANTVGVEVLKVTLWAYIATQNLTKAESTMKALEELVAKKGDASSSAKLTSIYLALGKELQQQVERLRNSGQKKDLEVLSKGVEMFLGQIAKKDSGTNFYTLAWVAETLYSLGAGMDDGGRKLPDDAKGYFTRAVESYGKIIERAKADPAFFPNPQASVSVKVRMAMCLRRLGQFKEAVDLFEEVLKAKPTMVDVQAEAAKTYQAWGDDKSGYYTVAIQGGRKHDTPGGGRENVIWGWGKLSKLTQGNEKFAETFWTARYNIAMCQVRLALAPENKNQRGNMLRDCERDIIALQRLFPRLGGPDWRKRFDLLVRKIQELREAKVITGLPRDAASESDDTNTTTEKPAATAPAAPK